MSKSTLAAASFTNFLVCGTGQAQGAGRHIQQGGLLSAPAGFCVHCAAGHLCKHLDMAADMQGADWSSYVVADGRLVTGQNPQSSEKMAHEVVKLVKASG